MEVVEKEGDWLFFGERNDELSNCEGSAAESFVAFGTVCRGSVDGREGGVEGD